MRACIRCWIAASKGSKTLNPVIEFSRLQTALLRIGDQADVDAQFLRASLPSVEPLIGIQFPISIEDAQVCDRRRCCAGCCWLCFFTMGWGCSVDVETRTGPPVLRAAPLL